MRTGVVDGRRPDPDEVRCRDRDLPDAQSPPRRWMRCPAGTQASWGSGGRDHAPQIHGAVRPAAMTPGRRERRHARRRPRPRAPRDLDQVAGGRPSCPASLVSRRDGARKPTPSRATAVDSGRTARARPRPGSARGARMAPATAPSRGTTPSVGRRRSDIVTDGAQRRRATARRTSGVSCHSAHRPPTGSSTAADPSPQDVARPPGWSAQDVARCTSAAAPMSGPSWDSPVGTISHLRDEAELDALRDGLPRVLEQVRRDVREARRRSRRPRGRRATSPRRSPARGARPLRLTAATAISSPAA